MVLSRKGWEVGEEVILKGNGKKYEISNFSERDGKLLIGLKGFILWVTEEQIQKTGCCLREEQLKANEETFKKIERYELERVKERIEKAENKNNNIKPNYYKINVAGTECEVKDVIKATVKDYESVLVANVIKYIMRYRGKNGLEDLKKARTYLDEIIEIMESKNEL